MTDQELIDARLYDEYLKRVEARWCRAVLVLGSVVYALLWAWWG